MHHDPTASNPAASNSRPAQRPTPEVLVDRFRRQGLFDTLRRDLMKEFQNSDFKSKFDTKLEEIVLDKLAYDHRRRKNDRIGRLGAIPPRPSEERAVGLSATKERHEDVMREVERCSPRDVI